MDRKDLEGSVYVMHRLCCDVARWELPASEMPRLNLGERASLGRVGYVGWVSVVPTGVQDRCLSPQHFWNTSICEHNHLGLFPVTPTVKNLPARQETRVQFLGWEDLLEKGMATHPTVLAWRIPRTEEPGRLQSTGSQRVRHD